MSYAFPRPRSQPGWWLLSVVVLVWGLQTHSAAAQAQKILTIEGITEYRFDNGLRLLLVPDNTAANVTVNMTVLVGSRHEGYGESGMAHLLEHMLFKGSPKFANPFKMLQARGADFQGTTSFDRTNYYETLVGSEDNLKFALELEADRLVHSFIKREDLIKEMPVVRNEFEIAENSPTNVLRYRLYAAAFEWHNYGKVTIGNRSDIERVPIARLQAFYKKYYRPDNVVLVVAGKFDESKALAYVGKFFGPIPRPKAALETTYTEEPTQDGERNVMLRRVGDVALVGFMYHVPATAHADFVAMEMMESVFFNNPAGRLYKQLVKGKKVASVNGGANFSHDPSVFMILANVLKEVPPEEVRDLIIAELEQLQTQPITKEELDRSRQSMLADFERKLANTKTVALELSEWIACGDWRLLYLHRERIKQATLADLNRVAKKYFQQSNRTVAMFLPSKEVVRADIPATPSVVDLFKDFKGGSAVAEGEKFDPTPENIEKRLQRGQLPSGIQLALLPKKTKGETVVANLTLRFGSEATLLPYTDAVSYLGGLMRRGTKKHTAQQLKDELNKLSATLSVSSSLGLLTVSLEAKRATLPKVLELVREVLREPTFPQEELDIFLRNTKTALEQSKSEPGALAAQQLMRKLVPYPKDNIRYLPTIAESLARLEKVTRAQLVRLYEDQLSGSVGELVVIGDFDADATVQQFQAMLEGWKAKVPYQRILEGEVNMKIPGSTEDILTPDKTNAVYLAAFVLQLQETDLEYLPLAVGNYILGHGPAGRLFSRLRVKDGLSYGAYSMLRASAREKAGFFLMQASCKPENMDKADKAALEELRKILKEGISKEDLRVAQKGMLQDSKVLRGSDGELLALLSEDLNLGRKMDYHATREKAIAALTPEEVNNALRNHLSAQRLIIMRAGDFQKKAESPKK